MLAKLEELGSSNSVSKQRIKYHNPLRISLKFLHDILLFWTKEENSILLDKGSVYDGAHNQWPEQKVGAKLRTKTLKQDRIDTLEQIYLTRIKVFHEYDFDFTVLDQK